MPYEIAFTRPVPISDREQYINECCVGGDAVVDALLPAVRARYTDIETNQEDWGWFIWFKKGAVRLAIDVHSDDGDAGQFRVRLTSRTKRLFGYKEADTAELDELRVSIEAELRQWSAADITIERDPAA
ncbi:MAG TPA: hypothetical protein VFZ31_10305 [Vicinamibacterales bacterium]